MTQSAPKALASFFKPGVVNGPLADLKYLPKVFERGARFEAHLFHRKEIGLFLLEFQMGAKNQLHEPSDTTRKLVENMARVGIPQEMIGKIMGLTRQTLAKHYRHELDTAEAEMISAVGGALFANAMSGNVSAQIFIMKTRAGWKETNKTELSGPDGLPLPLNSPVVHVKFNNEAEGKAPDS